MSRNNVSKAAWVGLGLIRLDSCGFDLVCLGWFILGWVEYIDLDYTGLIWVRSGWSGLVEFRFSLGCIGLVYFGLSWFSVDWIWLGWVATNPY